MNKEINILNPFDMYNESLNETERDDLKDFLTEIPLSRLRSGVNMVSAS